MNREIKFRAWCEERKQMLLIQKHSFSTNKSTPYGWNIGYVFDDLMQYTGLKDKKGKEIYEGDILKQTYYKEVGHGSDEESFDGYHLGEVVITANGVCLKKPLFYEVEIDKVVKLTSYKQIAGYRSEVLGNIYENPELWEDIKNGE